MKRSIPSHTRLTFLVIALLALAVTTAQAQTNLLVNPGFEAPFNAAGGNQLLQVAQGWTPWHVPQGPGDTESENVQPEYYPASDTASTTGTPHIHGGADAQQYWAFFATFQGGVFQRVTGIEPGSQVTFSAFAYVWSSSFDDPNVSEEDGSVLVQVGIDPSGGESGVSPSIVWSTPVSLYDSYNQYTVTTNATGSAVSVWVRAIVNVPVKSSIVYVDDASLTAAGSAPPPATNTPAPPTAVPATNTSAPVPATNTPAPAPSTTPVVAATNTPAPAATNTPVPAATNTSPPAATGTPAPTNTPFQIDSGEFPNSIIHTVRAGDTVGRLATLYGSTTDAIIAANALDSTALIFVGQGLVIPVRLAAPPTLTPTPSPGPAPTNAPSNPPPTGPGGTTTYVVRPGDTLRQVALRYNTTVAALAQLNGITNVNLIFVGQTLIVPAPGQVVTPAPQPQPQPQPTTYRVQPGDNLYRISLRFGVSMQALIQANNITNPNFVFVGQVLVIP